MTRWKVVSACWLGVLMVAGSAPAAEPPTDPLLEALVLEALQANPDLQVAEHALVAARQRPAQVGALPDPRLSIGYTNDGWGPSLGNMPDSNLAVVASQDLPFPGKLRLRSQVAGVETQQTDQQLGRARLSLTAAVRRSYYGLLLAQARLALVREQGEVWHHVEGTARARYAAGQGTQQDVLRTQVELTRNGQLVVERETEIAIRTAEINRLLARPDGTPVIASAGWVDFAEPLDVAHEQERARAISPELAFARLAVERARLEVDLARRDYKPDFVVQGGYMNRGGLEPMWQASVGINLPLRRTRRAAAVAEAEAQQRAAEARVQATELQLVLRTRERVSELEAARRTAALYAGGIVRQGESSVEAARASYETGRLPFITVLEALNSLYADRGTLLDLRELQARLRVDIDEASLERGGAGSSMAPPPPATPTQPAAASGASAMGSMSR